MSLQAYIYMTLFDSCYTVDDLNSVDDDYTITSAEQCSVLIYVLI